MSRLRALSQREHADSENYCSLYLVRNVRNVRHLHDTYGKVKKQKDWASDPKFTSLNPEALSWVDNLPTDLQVEYPEGDAPPWLPNHFVGNMHSYYHLNVIMVHRPQLMSSSSFRAGGSWKKHMEVCYDSAKKMCRLQEAVFHAFGLSGLLCMQRGINFVIYSVLTCTMIHLVSQAIAYIPIAANEWLFRLPLHPRIRNSTGMLRNTLHVTCVSLRIALRPGPCRRCKHPLTPCVRLSLQIQAKLSASDLASRTAVLEPLSDQPNPQNPSIVHLLAAIPRTNKQHRCSTPRSR